MIKTVDYNLKTERGHLRVRVPVKQMEIFGEIRYEERFQNDREAFREARKIYKEKYPEEAREFYGDRVNL